MNHDIVKILKKHFVFDKIFNVDQYRHQMDHLYYELSLLKKDYYNPNYRFIFIFFETDYYTGNRPGQTLRNLQRLLSTLDIPNFFCLLITDSDIKKYLDQLRQEETCDDVSISTILTLYPAAKFFNTINVNLNTEHIKKNYISLNSGIKRTHRLMWYSLLKEKNLLNKGFVSFNKPNKKSLEFTGPKNINKVKYKIPNSLEFIYNSSSMKSNEKINIRNKQIKKSLLGVDNNESYKNFSENKIDNLEEVVFDLEQSAFVNITTETSFNYPVYRITEKTFKPIVSKRPFILLSMPGSLTKLKDRGFKTFDRWWNEDYDNILDNEERILAVLDLVERISYKSLIEVKNIIFEMQEILDHNYNHFHNDFLKNELSDFETKCISNLNR